jgi:hypothetical protein
MTVKDPHAITIAATIDARRSPVEKRRVSAAHATRARHRTGME